MKYTAGGSALCWNPPLLRVDAASSRAAQEGILTGKSGRVLDPQGAATHAEVAAMLRRCLER